MEVTISAPHKGRGIQGSCLKDAAYVYLGVQIFHALPRVFPKYVLLRCWHLGPRRREDEVNRERWPDSTGHSLQGGPAQERNQHKPAYILII